MLKPKEYIDIWNKINLAANNNNDKEFWSLYLDYLNRTDCISQERINIKKMTERINIILGVK